MRSDDATAATNSSTALCRRSVCLSPGAIPAITALFPPQPHRFVLAAAAQRGSAWLAAVRVVDNYDAALRHAVYGGGASRIIGEPKRGADCCSRCCPQTNDQYHCQRQKTHP